MKTKTKALVLALCAVLLVVTTVFATMAYLTSTDKVTNTFTVGKVNITLDEADVTPYGEFVFKNAEEKELADRVKENEYKLIPGHTYIKDPVVHVAEGSENCWLFVKLENGLNSIIDSEFKDGIYEGTIENQMKENGWSLVEGTENIYYYKNIIFAKSTQVDQKVFSRFKIKNDADVASYENKEIVITAYAIQADGFATAQAAWAAAGSTFSAD